MGLMYRSDWAESPGVCLPVDPCRLALGLELRTSARRSRGNADSDRIGWTRAGREEMEDQVDPFQQTSSPYIARGCHAHQHSVR